MRLYVCLLLLGPCLSAPLIAQSTEADLKARLIDKPLYLRVGWVNDKLHFDTLGQLRGRSGQSSFTLSGVDVKDIHIEKNRLSIDGRRMGLMLGRTQTRVALQVGGPGDLHDEAVHIEVDAPPDGDYGPALGAIFVDNLTEIVPSLPDFWQKYAHSTFLPPETSDPPLKAPGFAPTSPDPHLQAPSVLESVQPAYTYAARLLKFMGVVTVFLIVEADGRPSHLSIARPVGLGLDEQAVAAVRKWKFAPAMKDGVPIPVELRIAVNFQIY